MKVIFLGTPDFAVPSLESIIKSSHKVVAVVTQPDKAVGREGLICSSPVKKTALANGIPVLQFNKIRAEGVGELRALSADIMVTCAYGQILSQEIIDICPHGIINVHGSLLPKYRGAAPVQGAIIGGESVTGISVMQTEAGIDTGGVLISESLAIGARENAGELSDRLSVLGAKLIVKALDLIESGNAVFTPQDASLASYVKMFKKQDGEIDFSLSARKLDCFVRGLYPWPCAFTFLRGKTLKVHKAEETDGAFAPSPCGTVVCADLKKGLIIATGEGFLKLTEIQEEGSKKMETLSYLVGHKINVGEKLGR